MILLHLATVPPTVCSRLSSLRPASVTSNAYLVSRVAKKSIQVQIGGLNGLKIQKPLERGAMIVKATEGIDGAEPESSSVAPSEAKNESLPVEELPLESKLQMKLDQKIKMKLAKKIRLRRKRLVRKRQLRKKGRWPPSKMKKNKNV